ncbi:MAG TPA: N-acetyltransferase [Bryobacteraceae bacterium]|nr:N-acetyltransferase [Bryobacteraceae bacterium]
MTAAPHFEEVPLEVRKASLNDLPELLRVINAYAAKGIMLPRTEFEMAENIRDFTVVYAGGRLAGCGALHLYTPQIAEVRSLAVQPESKGCGAGRKVVQALELEARAFGLAGVFAFTYIPRFFEKLGFREIDRGELPLKAWKDCLRCPKFSCCDEIAVIKYFDPSSKGVEYTLKRAHADTAPAPDPTLIPVPQVRNRR